MDTVAQDLRYALRMLRRSPALTVMIVASLALGIGANTAVFSVVRAVLIEPLPYHDAARLVMVWEDASQIGFPENTPASGNYAEWKARNSAFDGMAALRNTSLSLTGEGEPERLQGREATHDLFHVLGVAPLLGRTFMAEEDRPGTDGVAVISHSLWQVRFGGAREVIGRSILLDGKPHIVVGVMPTGFDFPEKGTQIWTPIAFTAEELQARDIHNLQVVARLKPGVTIEEARADMDTVASRLAEEHPETNANRGARVNPLRDQLVGNTGAAVALLLVIVGCVLLIASANVANLLLAQAVNRQKELAVRIAMGAGRPRLVRQLAVENFTLSAAGAGLGLLLAVWSFDFLSILVPTNLTSAQLALDAGVLAFTGFLCIATTLLFGLLPSRLAWRLGVSETLKDVGARSGGHRSARGHHGWLVATQMAFAVMLMIAAGLILQTFMRLRTIDPGFRGENVLTVRTALPSPRYDDPARRSAFYTEVLERVEALPGVTSAGYTSWIPYTAWGGAASFRIEGQPPSGPGLSSNDANVRLITPGYIPAMGMRLLDGRLLAESDRAGSEPVAVINETMARKFWPGEPALNSRFRLCPQCPWLRIVGVVGDIHQRALDIAARPEYFVSHSQLPQALFFAPPQDLAIRAHSDPAALTTAVREAIWAVDSQQPVAQVKVLADYLEEDLAPRRFQMQLLAGFAGLALLLASLGIYGVLSYSVAQRRREIGVRMALGAQASDLVRLVVSQGIGPAAGGLALGLIAAYALAHLISGLLYEVSAHDPLTFGAAAAALLAIALLACWIPARRASKVDPLQALRFE